jgi:hypothetical protein
MNKLTVRALSAGVSLASLGIAMPALFAPVAAQNVNNGSTQTGPTNLYTVPGTYVYEGAVSGDGSPDLNGDPFNSTVATDAYAIVNCYDENAPTCTGMATPGPGGIGQWATALGTADNDIIVAAGAILEVHALAADGMTPVATPDAHIIIDAINQSALGAFGGASNNITNDGTINVLVNAQAGLAGIADASATLNAVAIDQDAAGITASNTIDNNGDININVAASAAFATGADADAFLNVGISQAATGLAVSNMIDNDGSIDIEAAALIFNAAFVGTASADINTGIAQFADGTNASLTLDNSGTLGINANISVRAGTAALVQADLDYGIQQTATGTNADALVSNVGGTIDIGVSAALDVTGAGAANADANINFAAIDQNAMGDTVTLTLSNDGGAINITADADAQANTFARADATIVAGVSQNATGTQSASALINNLNGAQLNIVASANARGDATASALAFNNYAIQQTADADVAVASIVNSGTINLRADASAVADTGNALATADINAGVAQSAVGNERAEVTFDNTGGAAYGANIVADAYAEGFTDADAYARIATGLYQFASAVAAGGEAVVVANGPVNVLADADAVAEDGAAFASADITYGISQSASGGDLASVTFNNDGDMFVAALAQAVGTNATASASLGTGIYQYASANDPGASADVTLVNGAGQLNLVAEALATADEFFAEANATIRSNGIYQQAVGDDIATVGLLNNGGITIAALAGASGATGAEATATIDGFGIYQAASAEGVSISLTNNADLDIMVTAVARADTGTADAVAQIREGGIYQTAIGQTQASASLKNLNGANLDIVASASAIGTAVASASATLYSYPIFQNASATGTDGTATVSLINSGTINIVADAFASATDGSAFAKATLYSAAEQYATAEDIASVVLDNTGGAAYSLNIRAEADAIGATQATANVYLGTGVYQYASATGPDGVASAFLAGPVDVIADANAVADDGSAFASAYLSNAVEQIVSGGDLASATIGNDGEMIIAALANASGNDASATAYVDTGVYQLATADSVQLALTNGASLVVIAQADAVADAGSALAYASVETGVYQSADGVTNGSVDLDNTGYLGIAAIANATGTASARADAVVGTAIFQNASYADEVSISLNNSGTLSILAFANASGTAGRAQAYATLDGIYQSGFGTTSASVSLTNGAGQMTIWADASAIGVTNAFAFATVSEGIHQYATAQSATVTLNNGGSINIAADARAQSEGFAEASGRVETGIYQSADGASVASAVINGAGGVINVIAHGTAIGGTNYADASADINYGIFQDATANGVDGNATVSLSGSVNVQAIALASATDGYATVADAQIQTGIYQSAQAPGGNAAVDLDLEGGSVIASARAVAPEGATANALLSNSGIYQYASGDELGTIGLSNSGNLTIAAIAAATATQHASANATIGAGINQEANGEVATASLDNNGDLTILADANALSTDRNADAIADILGHGIYQSADGVTQASADISVGVNNNLNIIASAVASGAGTFGAYASAEIGRTFAGGGIYQSAEATTAASVSIVNNGTINVVATAEVDAAMEDGQAYARVYNGVEQFARAGDTASALVDNVGGAAYSLNIMAIADASAATSATAQAFVGTGLLQYASATAADGVATIVANGPIDVVANARAVSDTGAADAEATLDRQGIYQYANGGDLASAGIGNDGEMLIAALAYASGDTATATAAAGTGIYQYATADNAAVSAGNGGSLVVLAQADAGADLGNANADASLGTGIDQQAAGVTAAAVVLNNMGYMGVAAVANADGTAGASAEADIGSGLYQSAQADIASNSLISTGTLSILASANASATAGSAAAYADVETGIYQYAPLADTGSNSLINGAGEMTISARATAVGAETAFFAGNYANATVGSGIAQYVSADSAVNLIANDGSIDIGADALAQGTAFFIRANANIVNGINQDAFGSTAGSALIDGGGGDINVVADAVASGISFMPSAYARIDNGVDQYASATAADGLANVGLTGEVNVQANALVNSPQAFIALASADLDFGIGQSAYAPGGTGAVNLDLEGGSILAHANAMGGLLAAAQAHVTTAIDQDAYGQELATIDLTNNGALSMIAAASAVADPVAGVLAQATAEFRRGIDQYASASDSAHITFTNGGSIGLSMAAVTPGDLAAGDGMLTLAALANAAALAGDASANAVLGGTCGYGGEGGGTCGYGGGGIIVLAVTPQADVDNVVVGTVIDQYVSANNATIDVVNSGTVNLLAIANAAAGDSADAMAVVGIGWRQEADGGTNALVSLDNMGGELNVGAVANALGGTFASADAYVQTGVYQSASATNGNADAFLAGPVRVFAVADASAATGTAVASAEVVRAVQQFAFAALWQQPTATPATRPSRRSRTRPPRMPVPTPRSTESTNLPSETRPRSTSSTAATSPSSQTRTRTARPSPSPRPTSLRVSTSGRMGSPRPTLASPTAPATSRSWPTRTRSPRPAMRKPMLR